MPSQVKVCTMRSGRTVWKQPRNDWTSPSLLSVKRHEPPSRASHSWISTLRSAGPIHCRTRSGSVWARNTWSGVPAKSRWMWMAGTVGSASMAASA